MTFLSNTQPKEEEVRVPDEFSKDRGDVSKVPVLPPDVSALAAQAEIGSIEKPKVLVKEAEKNFLLIQKKSEDHHLLYFQQS